MSHQQLWLVDVSYNPQQNLILTRRQERIIMIVRQKIQLLRAEASFHHNFPHYRFMKNAYHNQYYLKLRAVRNRTKNQRIADSLFRPQ